METSARLLQLPTTAAVGQILNRQAKDALAALADLKHAENSEALHDLRVAIRRLRCTLKAYRPWLPISTKEYRQNLKTLANATSPNRDLDVQLAWLQELNLPDVPAVIALLKDQAQRDAPAAGLRQETRKTLKHLRSELKHLAKTKAAPLFRQSLQQQASTGLTAFEQSLAALAQHPSAAGVHKTRILGKQLRYLLEPVAGLRPDITHAINALTQWQDILGELHDCEVLASSLAKVGQTWIKSHLEDIFTLNALENATPTKTPTSQAGIALNSLEQLSDLLHQRHRRAWAGYQACFRNTEAPLHDLKSALMQL